MKIIIYMLTLCIMASASLHAEYIFLKKGKIIEGTILSETDRSVRVKRSDDKKVKIKRKNILRILYSEEFKNKVYIVRKDNTQVAGHIVFEDQESYKIREKLTSPFEIKILKSSIETISKRKKLRDVSNRAAVMAFSGKNVTAAAASIARRRCETELHRLKSYEVLDRSFVDAVMEREGIKMEKCTDTACAVKAGKLVNAGTVVLGEVVKYDEYTVTIKFVDVERSSILFTDSEKVSSEDDLERAVERLILRIGIEAGQKAVYRKNTLQFSLGGGYIYPPGEFGDIVKAGFGGSVSVYLSNLLVQDVSFALNGGFYRFRGTEDYIDSSQMYTLSFMAGYSFNILKGLNVSPFLGGGYMAHRVNWDSDGVAANYSWEYKNEYYFDPHALARLEIDYAVNTMWHVIAFPEYMMFFEEGSRGQTVGGFLGVKMYLN